MEPAELWGLGLDPADSTSSRSSRGCISAAASTTAATRRTILLVEPPEPFLGTTRLDRLPYAHMRAADFYPYGNPPAPDGSVA